MKQYIKNILNESIWQKGIQIKLPDGRFVYISRGNKQVGEEYIMNRYGIMVNKVKTPDELTKIVVCQPFTDGLKVSFELEDHEVEEEKLIMP